MNDLMCALKISLMITALYICCRDGMIFASPRRAVQNLLDGLLPPAVSYTLQKPLFACLMCMSSIWGLAGCWWLGVSLAHCIPVILQVCGLNAVINYFVRERLN